MWSVYSTLFGRRQHEGMILDVDKDITELLQMRLIYFGHISCEPAESNDYHIV